MSRYVQLVWAAVLLSLVPFGLRAQSTPPPVLGGIGGGGTVELGIAVSLSVSVSGSTTGLTYQWRKDGADLAGATNQNYNITAATAADAGAYAVNVTNAGGTSSASTTLTVKPAAAPVVTSQPRNVVAQVGQNAQFFVAATGSYPRTYQWQKDGTNIPGATSSLLTLSGLTNSDAAVYTLTISNAYGSTVSNGASLTVNAATPVVIASTTPADATYTQGTYGSLSIYLTAGSQPVSYQWRKDGTPIAGATSSQLTFNAVALTDAGKYTIVATNPAGSVTSREATLTVTPATPVSIGTQPVAQAIYQGQSATLSVNITSGSQPITYQWSKDGAAIAGATYGSYYISVAKLSDAGSYTVAITNAAGTVTSNPATVTVTPATPPAITRQPTNQTIPYFGQLSLDVGYTGTSPLTFVWKKDGVQVGSNQPDYGAWQATPLQSGVYTVTLTNAAGSVTSSPATVVVSPAVVPTITQQPAATEVAAGMSAALNVQYSTVGTGYVSVQWQKNGTAIPGATSSSYNIPSAMAADEGDYTAVVTGIAGAVTSNAAHLKILPSTPPAINYWPTDVETGLGQSTQLNLNFITGSPPLSYQWYKDGQAISGQTNTTLYLSNVRESDLGMYTATVANAGGVIASPPINVRLYASTRAPWIDAGQFGSIVYFLATSPNRIERYDLTAEQWLPTTTLTDPRTPTAMLPTSEGVYLAYGRTLVRRSLDLTTETPILNAVSDIIALFTTDKCLYYTAYVGATNNTVYTTTSIDRVTLQAGTGTQLPVHSAVFAPNKRLLFGTYDGGNSPRLFPVDANGLLGAPSVALSTDTFPAASRAFLFPGEQYVANGAGTIYRLDDLAYAGSLGERPHDIAFFGDGTVLSLRPRTIATFDPATFTTTGVTALPFIGWRAFVASNNAYVFGAAAAGGTSFQVTKIARAAITAPTPAPVSIAASDRYSIDDAFLGDDGVVHVLSRSKGALIRWSASTAAFLPPLALRSIPTNATQTAGAKRALFTYSDGEITEVPLNAGTPAERQIGSFGNGIHSIADIGGPVVISAVGGGYYTADWRLTLGTDGKPLFINGGANWPQPIGWNSTRRLLFSGPMRQYDPATLQSETVSAAGALAASPNTGPSITNVAAPIHFSADGAFIATGNGRILNSDLAEVGVLANDILDAAWLPSNLYTLRSASGASEVQRWSRTNYLETGTANVSGTPVRLFALSDTQLVVVTNLAGRVSFTVLNADLTTAATSSQPTTGAVDGAYFGKINSKWGDVALYVRADHTAVLVAQMLDIAANVVAVDIRLDASNGFRGTARNIWTGVPYAVAGFILPDGTFSGTIGSETISGAKVSGSSTAALYEVPAVNGGRGAMYAIAAPDGNALLLASGPQGSDGGLAHVSASGVISLTTGANNQLTISPVGTSGAVTGTGSNTFASTTYAGLRDDAVHTDRLANISTRGTAGSGDATMIAGFVIRGSSPRQVLIRAVGPALSPYGVTNYLADPRLELWQGNTRLATSDNWGAEAGASDIAAAADRVGAFKLPNPGTDAALLTTLAPGAYTAQATTDGTSTGVALVEVYDAGDGAPSTTPRLLNISTRGKVSASDSLIAGFVVTGNAPKRVLIRAVGPALEKFNISGTLPDPLLLLHSGSSVIRTNDDWGNAAANYDVVAAANAIGAFALPDGSRDAATLVTLQPGNYTAEVAGKNSDAGIALIEVYEVPADATP